MSLLFLTKKHLQRLSISHSLRLENCFLVSGCCQDLKKQAIVHFLKNYSNSTKSSPTYLHPIFFRLCRCSNPWRQLCLPSCSFLRTEWFFVFVHRLEICQKNFTTGFLGQKFYTLKLRILWLFLLKKKNSANALILAMLEAFLLEFNWVCKILTLSMQNHTWYA